MHCKNCGNNFASRYFVYSDEFENVRYNDRCYFCQQGICVVEESVIEVGSDEDIEEIAEREAESSEDMPNSPGESETEQSDSGSEEYEADIVPNSINLPQKREFREISHEN